MVLWTEAILQGMFAGLGNAIGTFIALKYVINHLDHEKIHRFVDIWKRAKKPPSEEEL